MPDWIAAPPGASRRGVTLVVLLFATGLTAVAVQESLIQGRLSVPPTFDDVSYMQDAADRVQLLYDHGVRSMLRDLLVKPPHSPYATLVAMLSFLIFGLREWAPYVLNAVVPLVFYAFVAYLGRGMRLWLRVCLLAAVTPIPMVILAAQEFRPDFLSATLTCIGAVLLAAEPSIGVAARRSLMVGAVFGAAVLAKPTALPATLAIFGLCCLLAAVVHRLTELRPGANLAAIRTWFVLVGGFAIVAGPFLITDRGAALGYAWFHTVGPGSFVWRHRALGASLRFYLDGEGGKVMLGPYVYGILGVLVLGGALCALRGTRPERLRSGALHAVVLAAFIICSLAPKHVFFGLPFQLMLLTAALLTIRRAILGAGDAALAPRAAAITVAALTGLSAVSFEFLPVWTPSGSDRAKRSREMFDLLNDRINALLPGPAATVLLTFTGDVNAANLRFRAQQERRATRYISWELAQTPKEYETWLGSVDLVVAIQSGTPWGIEGFASGKILDQTVAYMDQHPKFTRAAEMPIPGTARLVYFYRRR